MTTELTTITPEIERDRYGRPMIVPPNGGKKVAYRRCTTFVGVLEDTYNLSRWQQRQVALGLADRPDLLLGVAAHRDDKKKLDQLCEDALEASKGHAAATTGTALHSLTEMLDRGMDIPVIPDGAAADLEAYRKATAGIQWLAIEAGIVVDNLKVHGTPDRIGRLPDGRVVVLDLKTGSVEYGMHKIAQQLAVYSRGVQYDHRTGSRLLEPSYEVDQDKAVVIHLPAGTGRCELIEVDIAAGWEGVQLAAQVWEWRSRKGLSRPLAMWPDNDPALNLPADPIPGLIATATCEADLLDAWSQYKDVWTDAHTAAAAARKATLAASAA